jgi:hypothetical protein
MTTPTRLNSFGGIAKTIGKPFTPGGDGGTTTNTQYSASTAAAQAFIYVSQTMTQTSSAKQRFNLNCGTYRFDKKHFKYCDPATDPPTDSDPATDPATDSGKCQDQDQDQDPDWEYVDKDDTCYKCIKFWSDLNKKAEGKGLKKKPMKEIRDDCSSICECKVSNINMSQNVNLDLSIFQKANASTKFLQSFKQNIAQQANQQGGGLAPGFLSGGTDTTNTSKNITSLVQSFSDKTFQDSMQQFSASQSVDIEGPVIVNGLNMEQTVDVISKILSTSNATSQIISDMETEVLQAATSVSEAGLDAFIIMIIRLIASIVTIGVLLYTSSILFNLYSLIANVKT